MIILSDVRSLFELVVKYMFDTYAKSQSNKRIAAYLTYSNIECDYYVLADGSVENVLAKKMDVGELIEEFEQSGAGEYEKYIFREFISSQLYGSPSDAVLALYSLARTNEKINDMTINALGNIYRKSIDASRWSGNWDPHPNIHVYIHDHLPVHFDTTAVRIFTYLDNGDFSASMIVPRSLYLNLGISPNDIEKDEFYHTLVDRIDCVLDERYGIHVVDSLDRERIVNFSYMEYRIYGTYEYFMTNIEIVNMFLDTIALIVDEKK